MHTEIMEYLNNHPEKADIILAFEEKMKHQYGNVFYFAQSIGNLITQNPKKS